jgi:1-acyl-sn-glycerol-3-phosphate acyltransferase
MRDRIELEQMPKFWPPRPSRFWDVMLAPLHRRILHRMHQIEQVDVENMEVIARLDARDGVLICPNHSYTGDGSTMLEFGRRAPRRMYIMAAWHAFRGMQGFLLPRMGAFSVDREGVDRRAIKQAAEVLTTGKALCIFPEGEIYHLNDRITPLREGVAFIAATAQRDLDKAKSSANVWIVPTMIRYKFVDDVMPALQSAMDELEKHVLLRPQANLPLHERIIRFGEVALTIKEKEHLGKEGTGDLSSRIAQLSQHILAKSEEKHFGKVNVSDPTPVRVKLLRQKLLESIWEQNQSGQVAQPSREVLDGLADVHLALQLYSYPGDYVSSQPSVERMAETIEKFEEDVYGTYVKPKGHRRARVKLGEPINVKERLSGGRMRTVAADITTRLETSIRTMQQQSAVV